MKNLIAKLLITLAVGSGFAARAATYTALIRPPFDASENPSWGPGNLSLGPLFLRFSSNGDVGRALKTVPNGVLTTIDFVRSSRDGRDWVMDITYAGKFFSGIVGSQRPYLKVRSEVALATCDGEPILRKVDWTSSFAQIVSDLRDFDPRLYLTCSFEVRNEIFGDRMKFGGVLGVAAIHSSRLTLTDSDELILESFGDRGKTSPSRFDSLWGWRGPNTMHTFRVTPKSTDANLRARALAGKQRFVDLVRSHALLIATSATNQLPPAELRQVAKDSIREKKASILGALDEVNTNYGALSILDQVSISIAVHQAYDYLQYFEQRVAKFMASDERLNLGDRLIQERL